MPLPQHTYTGKPRYQAVQLGTSARVIDSHWEWSEFGHHVCEAANIGRAEQIADALNARAMQ